MSVEHEISSAGDTLPDLPDIADQDLLNRVYTHKSWAAASINTRAVVREPENNERLAFLGSHILTHVVSAKLYDMSRPILSKGDLTASAIQPLS
jgi:dsRNA-specific ribonuclease